MNVKLRFHYTAVLLRFDIAATTTEAFIFFVTTLYRDMRRLTTGIRSDKCVVRRCRRRANVIECTYTNLDSIAYYIPSLFGIAYCS